DIVNKYSCITLIALPGYQTRDYRRRLDSGSQWPGLRWLSQIGTLVELLNSYACSNPTQWYFSNWASGFSRCILLAARHEFWPPVRAAQFAAVSSSPPSDAEDADRGAPRPDR